ncbi:MAG TPA: hypothetical protein VEK33_14840 [Terriglobales bacterium]|nr:hypothetical protein [Terriglobales bacterium]
MDPRFLLNLLVGALALLGWAVLIIFLIEFREDVTIHPVYRMPEGPVNLPRAKAGNDRIQRPLRRKRDGTVLRRKRA